MTELRPERFNQEKPRFLVAQMKVAINVVKDAKRAKQASKVAAAIAVAAEKAEEVAKRKTEERAKQVQMRMARTEEQRQLADEAVKTAATNAMIARLSRACVAAALDKMPVMAEARAQDQAARRKAASIRELNMAAGIKAAKADKAAKEQRAEEALAKEGHTTKRARKRTKCCK